MSGEAPNVPAILWRDSGQKWSFLTLPRLPLTTFTGALIAPLKWAEAV